MATAVPKCRRGVRRDVRQQQKRIMLRLARPDRIKANRFGGLRQRR
jgi:hypothetical protein